MSTPDVIVQCPFNKEHLVIRHRMPYHIVKCKKNYKGPPLETCAYNAMHMLPIEQMPKHLDECKEYHQFMNQTYLKQNPLPENSLAYEDDC